MPIRVQWFDQQEKAVHLQYEGHWTWDQFYEANAQAMRLFDSIDHKAALIIDLSNSDMLPKGSIIHIRNVQGLRHDNMGSFFLVGANTFMQIIGNLAMRLNRKTPRDSYFVDTLDEVRQNLASAKNNASDTPHQQ